LVIDDAFSDSRFHSETLCAEPVVLLATPRHRLLARRRKLGAEDISSEAFLLTDAGCAYRSKLERALAQSNHRQRQVALACNGVVRRSASRRAALKSRPAWPGGKAHLPVCNTGSRSSSVRSPVPTRVAAGISSLRRGSDTRPRGGSLWLRAERPRPRENIRNGRNTTLHGPALVRNVFPRPLGPASAIHPWFQHVRVF
jgi:DNA-binding transcriptional LysR family regulator